MKIRKEDKDEYKQKDCYRGRRIIPRGYVGVFGGGFLAEPMLNAPDFPANIATDRSQLIIGLFMS
ncbi:MAG: hypothetical protein R2867_39250 [Caldilineaceae bacterium]